MPSSDEKPRGFSVRDRRSFGAEAEPHDATAAPSPAGPSAEAPTAPATPGTAPAATTPATTATPRLTPVDFTTFILSLGSSALLHLGEDVADGGPAAETNLPMAKHTVDILSMLQEKTKGNLKQPEAKLLEDLLYDLRLRYVAASKK